MYFVNAKSINWNTFYSTLCYTKKVVPSQFVIGIKILRNEAGEITGFEAGVDQRGKQKNQLWIIDNNDEFTQKTNFIIFDTPKYYK